MRQVVKITAKSDMKVSVTAVLETPSKWFRATARQQKMRLINNIHQSLRMHGFECAEISIKK